MRPPHRQDSLFLATMDVRSKCTPNELEMRESTFLRRKAGRHDILRGGRVEEKMAETAGTVFDFEVRALDGTPGSLKEFKGKVLLIVNTASQCGFTPQYAGLEKLYRTYKDRGLVVVGFPCNQFGAQEPGSAGEISAFCERNYGVSFPMFAKIDVNGKGAHPLYQYLRQKKPGLLGPLGGGAIKWNFTKFLVDRGGHVAARYAPSTKPESLTGDIEKLLETTEE
jgi:glutathione peroxidase